EENQEEKSENRWVMLFKWLFPDRRAILWEIISIIIFFRPFFEDEDRTIFGLHSVGPAFYWLVVVIVLPIFSMIELIRELKNKKYRLVVIDSIALSIYAWLLWTNWFGLKYPF
ncbi:MAG: hypothetical protein Q4D52_01735, partial [Eubacteriales bacterium]|nr:hypothetical protein [Eubacteriales bacterium]